MAFVLLWEELSRPALRLGYVNVYSCGAHPLFLCVLKTIQVLKWPRPHRYPDTLSEFDHHLGFLWKVTSNPSTNGTPMSAHTWGRVTWCVGSWAASKARCSGANGDGKRKIHIITLEFFFLSRCFETIKVTCAYRDQWNSSINTKMWKLKTAPRSSPVPPTPPRITTVTRLAYPLTMFSLSDKCI